MISKKQNIFILICEACHRKKLFSKSDLAKRLRCPNSVLDGAYLDKRITKFKCASCGEYKIRQFSRNTPIPNKETKYFGTFDYKSPIHSSNTQNHKDQNKINVIKPKPRKECVYSPDVSALPKEETTVGDETNKLMEMFNMENKRIMVICTYDGRKYPKGSTCPNDANHKEIGKLRKNKKYGELYGRMKNGVQRFSKN